MLCLVTVMSYQDLSLAKTHGAQFQDLMKLRFFMSHCKKFSERHSNRQEVDLFKFREKHAAQSVGHHRGQARQP